MGYYFRIQNISTPVSSVNQEAPWPHWRGIYLNNTGQSPYPGPMHNGLKWRYLTTNSVVSSPVIDKLGSIYFGAGSFLYACTSSGSLKWSFRTAGTVSGTAALDRYGVVYFGSVDTFFYAVNTTTGNEEKILITF